jgi:choline dehydrogenase-like flavoprotein
MRSLGFRELAPGEGDKSDLELEQHARALAKTVYHPAGTCKMGNDDMAVVDNRLRVIGVPRLRVADASIMPTLVSGNTNAPCIMIAERCADFLLARGQG